MLFKRLHMTVDKQKTVSGLTANSQAQSDIRKATRIYSLSKKHKNIRLNNEKFNQWKQYRDTMDATEEATLVTG